MLNIFGLEPILEDVQFYSPVIPFCGNLTLIRQRKKLLSKKNKHKNRVLHINFVNTKSN